MLNVYETDYGDYSLYVDKEYPEVGDFAYLQDRDTSSWFKIKIQDIEYLNMKRSRDYFRRCNKMECLGDITGEFITERSTFYVVCTRDHEINEPELNVIAYC